MTKTAHPRVLVVDDDSDIRLLVRSILEGQEFVCEEAEGGAQALDMIPGFHPDIVLMDESMPGLSGSETAVKIRKGFPTTKIVLFSASIGRMSEIRGEQPGSQVDLWIPKEKVVGLPEILKKLLAG